MTSLNVENVREELSNFLRYSDVLSTSIRNVTRITGESYTVGVGGETAHTFAHNPIRDFKSVTVNAVAKYFLRDYTVNWTTGVLTWNTALVNNDAVLATYDYSAGTGGDKIYPDRPRDNLTLESMPRIGIELTSGDTKPLGIGGTTHITDLVVTVYVWVSANKDSNIASGFGGMADLESTHNLIRDAIRGNAKLFYFDNHASGYIYPKNMSPIMKGTNSKIMQQTQDFMIRFLVEV